MDQRDAKHANDNGAAVGLPGAAEAAEQRLHGAGIDPDRLSITPFGLPAPLHARAYPPWVRRMTIAFLAWLGISGAHAAGIALPGVLDAMLALAIGLVVLQSACDALITAAERIAARVGWPHYIAGTVVEILSTLPELVVIAFVIPVSPLTAFVIALVTIYNNALVFSLYSYLLPKDHRGKFLMPEPVTDAGTKILVAGAALGLALGLVLLAAAGQDHPKSAFTPVDLAVLGAALLTIFIVYVYVLLTRYAEEEMVVQETLDLTPRAVMKRRRLVYENVTDSPWSGISVIMLAGIVGAFIGGEQVAHFAATAIDELGFNHILTSLLLAGFAGMSEYVILWRSHRKGEYGIALANAFGGITQVMYLVFPFTLLAIAGYQAFVNPDHPELPIGFSLSNVLLLVFLAPTFFVLAELIDEDHTLSILDTSIMTMIFVLLILMLVTYGAAPAAVIPSP